MSMNPLPREDERRTRDMDGYLDEAFIQKVWQECNCQVSRAEIRAIVMEIAAEFQDATITAFVPIFIRRRLYEELDNRREASA